MSVRRVKNEAIENLQKAVKNDSGEVEAVGDMGIVMSDAYNDSIASDRHIQAIKQELDKTAEAVITKNPDEGKTPKNNYTAPLQLSEEVAEFDLKKSLDDLDDTEDKDFHLDYDMMDFLYACFRGLEGNANRNPNMKGFLGLDRPVHTFSPTIVDKYSKPAEGPNGNWYIHGDDTGIPYRPNDRLTKSDNYTWVINGKDTGMSVAARALDGECQLTTNGMNKIFLSNDNLEYFEDAIKICQKLELTYTNPQPRRSKADYWNYTMTVMVPSISYGYPMMLADYLETIDLTVADVMTPEFTKTYYSKLEKLRKEQQMVENDFAVKKMIDRAISVAMNDDEPIEDHLNQLFKDLRKAKLKFNKAEVTDQFMSEF